MNKASSVIATFVWLVLVGAAAYAQTAPAAQADKAAAKKIVQMLEESGLGYTKHKDNVWVVKGEGKELGGQFDIILTSAEQLLVLLTVIAEKHELKATPELMQKLLRLNADLDRVKISIDKDGDLLVRTDLSWRTLDTADLEENLEVFVTAVDMVYAASKPFIIVPKKVGK